MVGQPRRDKDLAVELQRREAESKAEARRNVFGAIANTFFDFPQNTPKPSSFGGDKFLKKDGDIMRGGIEHPVTTITIASDLIGASNQLINSNRIILRGEGGLDDDGLAMIFPKFESDMIVYISNEPGFGDITLLNDNTNASNFRLIGNVDLVLTAGRVHTLWFDSINDLWREVSSRDATAGAGEVFTWTNNHSAAGFDLTSLSDILFNAGGASIKSSATGLANTVSSTLAHSFIVGATSIMSVNSAGVTIVGNTAVVGNFSTISGDITAGGDLLLPSGNQIGSDVSGNIELRVSSSTDEVEFIINSVVIARIGNAFFDLNDNEIRECGPIKFGSTSALTGTDVGWSGLTGDIFGNVQSGDSYFLRENGSTIVEIDADGIDIRSGFLELRETTAPAGQSNDSRIYSEDNGAGKTKLMVKFGTGAAVQLAIEP